MKRGEIWQANLDPRSGSEQRGNRPVLVLSSDVFNDIPTWKSFIVLPCSTSGKQAARGPSAVPLAAGAGGLAQDSYVLCHQITTIDHTKFISRVGLLSDEELRTVEQGVLVALDMMHLTRRFQ